MTIPVQEIKTSALILDNDWSEGDFAEGLHLALRCAHDRIVYDREIRDMWCPDCENKQLNDNERLAMLDAHDEGER